MLNYTSLEVNASLDEFVTRQHNEISALGEEVADMFDIDVG
jgi:uncharacterized membrane protein YjgN (DUF898 family)